MYDHYLIYHISDNNTIKCRQRLSEIEDTLKDNKNFVKTHRSYIVNMDYISRIDQNSITMTNGDIVSVAKANHKAISDSFLKYKFDKGGK